MPKNEHESVELNALTLLADELARSRATNEALMARLEKLSEKKEDPSLDPARNRLKAAEDARRSLPKHEDGPQAGQHYIAEENIPVHSEVSGIPNREGRRMSATFVANIQRGKVIRFYDYTVPEEIFVPELEGGLCPMPRAQMFETNSNVHTTNFKRWVYENYYKVDALHYVGHALPEHMRRAWEESERVKTIDHAAE